VVSLLTSSLTKAVLVFKTSASNVLGAGFGTRPSLNTGSSLIDSIVWVTPGGECDGMTNTSSPRFDFHCGLAYVSVHLCFDGFPILEIIVMLLLTHQRPDLGSKYVPVLFRCISPIHDPTPQTYFQTLVQNANPAL
jgi:hypothetical protein